jgi:hypothetical protein
LTLTLPLPLLTLRCRCCALPLRCRSQHNQRCSCGYSCPAFMREMMINGSLFLGLIERE